MAFHLTILATTECNLRCRYCFSVANTYEGRPLLTVRNARKIITHIDVPVTSISLSGGEPFLHPNLLELYHLFSQSHPTSITTNATIACDHILQVPLGRQDLHVTVSLNAIDEDIDRRMRGTHCTLEPIIDNVRRLSTVCKTLKVNTMVCSANLDHLYELGHFLACINARDNLLWSLLQITLNSNVMAECSDLLLSERQFEETASNVHEVFRHMMDVEWKTCAELARGCCMISPLGDVLIMARSNRPIGNVLEDKLSDIIRHV